MKKDTENKRRSDIDWSITALPLAIILVLTILLMCFPERSKAVVDEIRSFFVNELGFFYILLGLGVIFISVGIALSRHGKIRLGTLEKPKYGNFQWGAMIFTSGLAADVLYWSLIEWAYYFNADPFGTGNMSLAERQDTASMYPLFHWGPIPWAFYMLPSCAYAYMIFVKKRKRQRISEACRPILKHHVDGIPGKVIDSFAIVGLLAGTATTFSMATPLLAKAASVVFGIPDSTGLSVALLCIIGAVFIIAVLKGMKAISYLASACVGIFGLLLAIFFLFGPKIYIIETGITAVGNMFNNFLRLSTWMDPLRVTGDGGSGFPQTWTIFYWAYWVAWFVAIPFFIAKISEGRTIRQTILGGLISGLAGTYLSFIVFGGFGMHMQTAGKADPAGMIAEGASAAEIVMTIFSELPVTKFALLVLIFSMVAFYASSFDAISLVVAGYSEKSGGSEEEPRKGLRAFWSLIFLVLPVGLLFSESTLSNLQTVSIIAAFPLGIIMVLVIAGFLKELRERKD